MQTDKNKKALSNIELNDYSFEFTATESTKGGTLIYIENSLRYKICKDLNLYREKEIEPTFVEIIEPNSRNKKQNYWLHLETSKCPSSRIYK